MWNILHVHVPHRMHIEYVEYPTCTCTEQLYIVWMQNEIQTLDVLNYQT